MSDMAGGEKASDYTIFLSVAEIASARCRWIFGVSGIVGAAVTIVQLVLVPETRHTVILGKRAAKLRKETGDDRYHALGAISGHRSIKEVLEETLYRPVCRFFKVKTATIHPRS